MSVPETTRLKERERAKNGAVTQWSNNQSQCWSMGSLLFVNQSTWFTTHFILSCHLSCRVKKKEIIVVRLYHNQTALEQEHFMSILRKEDSSLTNNLNSILPLFSFLPSFRIQFSLFMSKSICHTIFLFGTHIANGELGSGQQVKVKSWTGVMEDREGERERTVRLREECQGVEYHVLYVFVFWIEVECWIWMMMMSESCFWGQNLSN